MTLGLHRSYIYKKVSQKEKSCSALCFPIAGAATKGEPVTAAACQHHIFVQTLLTIWINTNHLKLFKHVNIHTINFHTPSDFKMERLYDLYGSYSNVRWLIHNRRFFLLVEIAQGGSVTNGETLSSFAEKGWPLKSLSTVYVKSFCS